MQLYSQLPKLDSNQDCPSVCEWIHRLCYIQTMDYDSMIIKMRTQAMKRYEGNKSLLLINSQKDNLRHRRILNLKTFLEKMK